MSMLFIAGHVIFTQIAIVVNYFDPVRVSDEAEIKGLDESIHGEMAYDFND